MRKTLLMVFIAVLFIGVNASNVLVVSSDKSTYAKGEIVSLILNYTLPPEYENLGCKNFYLSTSPEEKDAFASVQISGVSCSHEQLSSSSGRWICNWKVPETVEGTVYFWATASYRKQGTCGEEKSNVSSFNVEPTIAQPSITISPDKKTIVQGEKIRFFVQVAGIDNYQLSFKLLYNGKVVYCGTYSGARCKEFIPTAGGYYYEWTAKDDYYYNGDVDNTGYPVPGTYVAVVEAKSRNGIIASANAEFEVKRLELPPLELQMVPIQYLVDNIAAGGCIDASKVPKCQGFTTSTFNPGRGTSGYWCRRENVGSPSAPGAIVFDAMLENIQNCPNTLCTNNSMHVEIFWFYGKAEAGICTNPPRGQYATAGGCSRECLMVLINGIVNPDTVNYNNMMPKIVADAAVQALRQYQYSCPGAPAGPTPTPPTTSPSTPPTTIPGPGPTTPVLPTTPSPGVTTPVSPTTSPIASPSPTPPTTTPGLPSPTPGPGKVNIAIYPSIIMACKGFRVEILANSSEKYSRWFLEIKDPAGKVILSKRRRYGILNPRNYAKFIINIPVNIPSGQYTVRVWARPPKPPWEPEYAAVEGTKIVNVEECKPGIYIDPNPIENCEGNKAKITLVTRDDYRIWEFWIKNSQGNLVYHKKDDRRNNSEAWSSVYEWYWDLKDNSGQLVGADVYTVEAEARKCPFGAIGDTCLALGGWKKEIYTAQLSVFQCGSMAPGGKCNDSDNGKDIFTKGSVVSDGNTYIDTCQDESTVLEWYCSNEGPTQEAIACPEGYSCQDGACVSSLPPCACECSVVPNPAIQGEDVNFTIFGCNATEMRVVIKGPIETTTDTVHDSGWVPQTSYTLNTPGFAPGSYKYTVTAKVNGTESLVCEGTLQIVTERVGGCCDGDVAYEGRCIHTELTIAEGSPKTIAFRGSTIEEQLVWTVANIGTDAAVIQKVAVDCDSCAINNTYEGTKIEPGTSTSIVANLTASTPGEYTATLTIEYTDEYGLTKKIVSSKPIKINVLNVETGAFRVLLKKGVDESACVGPNGEIGYTGIAAVPKIKLAWDFESINEDTCSEIYCDATQFSISLAKRLREIIASVNNGDLGRANSLMRFRVRLINDSFSESFKNDFVEYYRNEFFATPNWFLRGNTPIYKYFSEPSRLVFEPETVESGVYDVTLEVIFESEPYSFFEAAEPSAIITVKFNKVRDAEADVLPNPFYYIPFDGFVGTNKPSRNYGAGFSNLTEPILIANFEQSTLTTSSVAGFKTFTTELYKEPAEISNAAGIVSSIDLAQNKIVMYNSKAVPVAMGILSSDNKAQGFYQYFVNSQPIGEVLQHNTYWTLVAASPELGCMDYYGKEFFMEPDTRAKDLPENCAERNNAVPAFGFYWKNVQNNKQVILGALLYVPSNAEASISNACGKEQCLIATQNSVSRSKSEILPLESSQYVNSIKEMLALVRNGYICMAHSGSDPKTASYTFFWNINKFKPEIMKAAQKIANEYNISWSAAKCE